MEKPNLEQMWHTYVKIGSPISFKKIQDTIRFKIYPMISRLKSDGIINWYHFLIHPNPKDRFNKYFHIRFSVIKDIDRVDDLQLPEYCASTKKIDPIQTISGINKDLLKNEEIEEAWRLIGEQSEWIMNMINIHKENIGWIPIEQFIQFMHFFMNMMGLGHWAKINNMTF